MMARDTKTIQSQHRGVRWLSVALRAAHLASVVALGAAIHGAPLDSHSFGLAVLASGCVLFALDIYANRDLLKQISGQSVVLKLLLVAGIVTIDAMRLPLFWIVVFWSAIFSHAPGSLRHRRLFAPARPADPRRPPG